MLQTERMGAQLFCGVEPVFVGRTRGTSPGLPELVGEGRDVIVTEGATGGIMVIHEGRVTGFLDRSEADQVKIMELASH